MRYIVSHPRDLVRPRFYLCDKLGLTLEIVPDILRGAMLGNLGMVIFTSVVILIKTIVLLVLNRRMRTSEFDLEFCV